MYLILDLLILTALGNFIYIAIFGEFNGFLSRMIFITIALVTIVITLRRRRARKQVKDQVLSHPVFYQPKSRIVKFLTVLLLIITLLVVLTLSSYLYEFRNPMPTTVCDTLGEGPTIIFLTSIAIITFLYASLSVKSYELDHKIVLLGFIPISILVRSLFILTFDAGYGSDQWIWLGYARTLQLGIHSKTYPEGREWPPSMMGLGADDLNIFQKIFAIINECFQAVLTLTISSLTGIDIHYVNLFLVPVLSGIYIPLIFYELADRLTSSRILAFFSMVLSTLPTILIWQAVSVPQSLSLLFSSIVLREILLSRFINGRLILIYLVNIFTHGLGFIVSTSWILLALVYRMIHKKSFKAICSSLIVLFPAIILWLFQKYRIHTEAQPLELNLFAFNENILPILLIDDVTIRPFFLTTAVVYATLLLATFSTFLSRRFSYKRSLFKKFQEQIEEAHVVLFVAYIITYLQYLTLNLFRPLIVAPQRLVPFLFILVLILLPQSLYYLKVLLANFQHFKVRFKVRFKIRDKTFTVVGENKMTKLAVVFSLTILLVMNIYYGYPHRACYGVLTGAELEAAKKLHEISTKPYLVLSYYDFGLAGASIVGIGNPIEYYDYPNWVSDRWSNKFYRDALYDPKMFFQEINTLRNIGNFSSIYLVVSTWRQGVKIVDELLKSPFYKLYLKEDHVYVFEISSSF